MSYTKYSVPIRISCGGFMMNQYYKGPVAAPYNIEVVRTPNGPVSRLRGSFETIISYVNGLNDPITIVGRDGINIVIPPDQYVRSTEFVIRLTYCISKSVNFDSNALLSTVSDDKPELKSLKQSDDNRRYSIPHQRGEEIIVEHVINYSVLKRRGGSIYLKERDLIISLHQGNLVPLHPYSDAGEKLTMIEGNKEINSTDTFGISIQIVDNNAEYGDRFTNINNRVYRIPARRQPSMTNGVYFTSSASVTGDYDYCPPESTRHDFADADKVLNLWKRYEEALHFGDVSKAKELEIETLKFQMKQAEGAHALDKLAADRINLDLSMRLKREEHARAMSKYMRADLSEMLKYIPVIITGIGACIIAYNKIKSSQSS